MNCLFLLLNLMDEVVNHQGKNYTICMVKRSNGYA